MFYLIIFKSSTYETATTAKLTYETASSDKSKSDL